MYAIYNDYIHLEELIPTYFVLINFTSSFPSVPCGLPPPKHPAWCCETLSWNMSASALTASSGDGVQDLKDKHLCDLLDEFWGSVPIVLSLFPTGCHQMTFLSCKIWGTSRSQDTSLYTRAVQVCRSAAASWSRDRGCLIAIQESN